MVRLQGMESKRDITRRGFGAALAGFAMGVGTTAIFATRAEAAPVAAKVGVLKAAAPALRFHPHAFAMTYPIQAKAADRIVLETVKKRTHGKKSIG
jgi:hypothetical protein